MHGREISLVPRKPNLMGIIADQMRDVINQLQELDDRQVERTQELITSVDNYIRLSDALLEDLSDIGED